jgi:serine/threonine protein phosphatase PrpC
VASLAPAGCEDVITWQVPFAWKPGNAMLALFDGHQGVKAADAAKQLIPKLLQEKTVGGGNG